MDEKSQIDGKPFPKNSKIQEESNEPRESMDNQNEQNQENQINNEDNNFPEAPNNYNENENDDFDKYNGENNNNNNGENNENEEYNNDFNNDNNFKDDDKDYNNNNDNNDNKNNDGSVRFSNLTDNNNRFSSANDENNNQKKENENDLDFVNDNTNNNNNNNDFGENYDNNNNNYNNNDNFGFNESDMKENDNNFNDFNPNQNQQNENNFNNNNEKDNKLRGSGNSEHLEINENNNNNNNNINNENNYNKQNNSILRNRNNNNNFNNNFNNNYNNNNNNFNNNNRNNNFNYASNPYNNNNNQNGGQNYNINTTATQFIPQDNHAMNNLNYNYSSNYGGSNQVHHDDYHSYYERFEELPEDSDGYYIDPEKNSSFSTTLAGIHIANHLMGAGLLSAPIIMSYLGLLVGIIFYIFMTIMTLYSVYILMRCHEITGKSGYSMLAKVTIGKVGNIIVKVVLIIQGFGLCSAYLRIFGECLQTIFQAWISKGSYLVEDSQVYLFILFGGLIMIIFVLIKKISNLKRFTFLGMIIGLVICISISILLFYKGIGNYLDSDISWDSLFPDCSFSEAFQSSSTIFVAFLFQPNAFSIYYSIKHRNRQSMMKATKIGAFISLLLFLIFGILGLFLYGFDIDDTILENFYEDMGDYKDSNTFIVIMLILLCLFFILLTFTSFPILFKTMIVNFVNSIIICTKGCRRSGSEQVVQISQNNSQKKSNYLNKKIFYFINILSYIIIISFAILIYRIQTLLTIVGATTGIFLIFILPNLFYLIIIKQTGKKYHTCLPIALVGFGVFFFVNAIITAFF